MPFLIERVTEVVLALFALVLLGDLCLIGIVLIRRKRRQKFFDRVDTLRERYGPVLASILSGRIAYEKGLEELRRITGTDRSLMLERLCLERKPTLAEETLLRRLCEDLGLVATWQQRLAGRFRRISLREVLKNPQGVVTRARFLRFLVRSKCAENLGRIRHAPSWPLLAKALEDPNPDLQAAAARALGAIRHPDSFPELVKRLEKATLPEPVFSVRTLKSALVGFPLHSAGQLIPALRHPNPRIRFLATDIIREMVKREADGNPEFCLNSHDEDGELAKVFLTELPFDKNPDVRARAAPVIAYLDDVRSAPILFALLEDVTWFVRLHTVRSLAKPRFLSHADWVAGVLTDPNWRVREAAVRTLKALGPEGVDLLTEHFLATEDRYSREQIADEFQRAGLIPQLLARCVENGNSRETAVLSQLVEMGKTSYIFSVLDLGEGRADLRKAFLRKLGQEPALEIPQWVERVTLQRPRSDGRSRTPAHSPIKNPRGKG